MKIYCQPAAFGGHDDEPMELDLKSPGSAAILASYVMACLEYSDDAKVVICNEFDKPEEPNSFIIQVGDPMKGDAFK